MYYLDLGQLKIFEIEYHHVKNVKPLRYKANLQLKLLYVYDKNNIFKIIDNKPVGIYDNFKIKPDDATDLLKQIYINLLKIQLNYKNC